MLVNHGCREYIAQCKRRTALVLVLPVPCISYYNGDRFQKPFNSRESKHNKWLETQLALQDSCKQWMFKPVNYRYCEHDVAFTYHYVSFTKYTQRNRLAALHFHDCLLSHASLLINSVTSFTHHKAQYTNKHTSSCVEQPCLCTCICSLSQHKCTYHSHVCSL